MLCQLLATSKTPSERPGVSPPQRDPPNSQPPLLGHRSALLPLMPVHPVTHALAADRHAGRWPSLLLPTLLNGVPRVGCSIFSTCRSPFLPFSPSRLPLHSCTSRFPALPRPSSSIWCPLLYSYSFTRCKPRPLCPRAGPPRRPLFVFCRVPTAHSTSTDCPPYCLLLLPFH